MEITPHYPNPDYLVTDYPVDGENAFVLYVNGVEINTLKTNMKTIVSAINEIWDIVGTLNIDDLVTKDELQYAIRDFVTKDNMENFVNTEIDKVNDSINEVKSDLADVGNQVETNKGDIAGLKTDVSDLQKKVTEPLFYIQTVFTNPAYFTVVNDYGAFSAPDYVAFSYEGNVEQDIQLTDGIIEVLNINLNRNIELDYDKMPHNFYIPMTVEHYDESDNFISADIYTAECEWSLEMNGYDISVYFKGAITVGEKSHFKISGVIPYKPIRA